MSDSLSHPDNRYSLQSDFERSAGEQRDENADEYVDKYTGDYRTVIGDDEGFTIRDGEQPMGEAQDEGPTAWSMVRELIETIVLSLIIFLLIRQVVQNYRIESYSMEPNFYEGQFILVNKLGYRLGEPERGDVVVFHNPNNTSEDYIKRIIGRPGDTVEGRDGQIFVNGELLNEPYATRELRPSERFGPITVSPDHLFVMGDNRPNSSDSRRFGEISQDLVVGKAWVRVYPLNEMGVIQHYDLEPGAPAISFEMPLH